MVSFFRSSFITCKVFSLKRIFETAHPPVNWGKLVSRLSNYYISLNALADGLYQLDAEISKAAIAYKSDPKKLSIHLSECFDKSQDLLLIIPKELPIIMGESQKRILKLNL